MKSYHPVTEDGGSRYAGRGIFLSAVAGFRVCLSVCLLGGLTGCGVGLAPVAPDPGPVDRVVVRSACGGESPPRFRAGAPRLLPRFQTKARGTGRDGGSSALVGEDLVWVFGDTFVGDDTLLSATMARSSRNNPTVLREATDATGAPFPLYPASPQELAFDRAHASPPPCCKIQDGCPRGRLYCHCDPSTDCAARIALWPGDVIGYPDGRAVNFYEKVLVGTAFYDFTVLGTGVALIEPSSTTAFRYRDSQGEPLVLFGPGEPNFKTALRASDGSDTVYVFARVPVAGCAADVLLGRVHAAKLHRREAYRFWNGCGWSEHLEDAEPVMDRVAGGMTSVAWNDHLGAYLAATGGLCTGGRELHLRAARRPEGPWGEPVVVDLSPVGADEDAYAARLHPDLDHGSDLMVSYYQPAVVDGQVIGEVRLVTVPLAAGRQAQP